MVLIEKATASPKLIRSFMPKFVERQILVQDAVPVKAGFRDGSGRCFCLRHTASAGGVTELCEHYLCYLPYPDSPRKHEQAQAERGAVVIFNCAQGFVMSR